jgi:hypothetical protein
MEGFEPSYPDSKSGSATTIVHPHLVASERFGLSFTGIFEMPPDVTTNISLRIHSSLQSPLSLSKLNDDASHMAHSTMS